jgi:hypothetical protein
MELMGFARIWPQSIRTKSMQKEVSLSTIELAEKIASQCLTAH